MRSNNPFKKDKGVEIENIQSGTVAEKAGLHSGDRLISINGYKVRDVIDLLFYGNEPWLKLLVERNSEKMNIGIDAPESAECGIPDSSDYSSHSLGITLKPFKVKTCRNNCIFCFVSQLPRGLRKSLYIKDEDYRMSFLCGSYTTMTNLSDTDKERIIQQRLSPLYISVHCTDAEIRNRLLGNPKATDILKEIRFLYDNKIRMHTQIVLCPGYNDGKNLEKTIIDLYKFYPYVISIAVVPVGLTAHRKKARTLTMKPVEKDDALKALEILHKLQHRFKKRHGEHIVFAADEMYIKAEMQFPPLKHYGELPQIENGVGMVPLFIHQSKRIKIFQAAKNTEYKTQNTDYGTQITEHRLRNTDYGTQRDARKRFVTFTGTSFYPYLSKFGNNLKKGGVDIEVIRVENTFFGRGATVTGLLTGRDVMKSLSGVLKKDDILLIPDVVMREGDEVFLDNVSKQDVEDVLGIKIVVVESTPKGIVDAIMAHSS